MSKINGWTDDYKVVHVATLLQDDANRNYWECTEERLDWETLINSLKEKFSPEGSRASFEAALESRRRKADESLDKFMTELRTLARKVYPDWAGMYRDKLARKYFIDGLSEDLKMWVLQSNPKTSDEALQSALRSEANLNQKKSKHVEVAAVTTSQPTGTSELAETIAQDLKIAGIGSTPRDYSDRGRNNGAGPRRGSCHACGENEHFWRDASCPMSPLQTGNARGAGMY